MQRTHAANTPLSKLVIGWGTRKWGPGVDRRCTLASLSPRIGCSTVGFSEGSLMICGISEAKGTLNCLHHKSGRVQPKSEFATLRSVTCDRTADSLTPGETSRHHLQVNHRVRLGLAGRDVCGHTSSSGPRQPNLPRTAKPVLGSGHGTAKACTVLVGKARSVGATPADSGGLASSSESKRVGRGIRRFCSKTSSEQALKSTDCKVVRQPGHWKRQLVGPTHLLGQMCALTRPLRCRHAARLTRLFRQWIHSLMPRCGTREILPDGRLAPQGSLLCAFVGQDVLEEVEGAHEETIASRWRWPLVSGASRGGI